MKLSAYLVALCWSSFTIATPSWYTETSSAEDLKVAEKRDQDLCRRSQSQSHPQSGYHPSTYGQFKYPIVPPLPPAWLPFPKSSKNGNTTCDDANQNPLWPNTPTHRGNWAPGYNINTDPITKWPQTGRTVRYTLSIAEATLAPDGIAKPMMVVNGQYPGPTITANWGDWLEITVINNLKVNGTGIHWHGFRQVGTNLMDGAGGATECPLAPGDSKVYRFQATSFGSSWYHSHFSSQYGDGVVGGIVINGPSSANYDIDMGAVLISDLYPLTASQESYFAERQGPPQASNYLINGQNVGNGGTTGQRAKFTLTPGKKHLFRLINTSMDALFKLSIDGHKIQVIQADFVPIVPYYTNEVSMHLGQRYHIIVEANQKPSNYFFRAMAALDCSNIANDGTGTANAVVSYLGAPNFGLLPNSTATNHTNTCVDEPIASLVPVVPQSVDSTNFATSAKIEDVNIDVIFNPEFVFRWTLGGTSMVLDWGAPVIGQAALGNNTYAAPRNVNVLNSTNQWNFWVIQNRFFVPHPMHLHGHDFNLLGQGNGIFNPATDAGSLNFVNPPRRDVALLGASGWMVIAFKSDNPGAWLLHCHIAWHAGEGLSTLFVERPQDIVKQYQSQVLGPQYQRTCKNWNSYAASMPFKQTDSGLRRRDDSDVLNIINLRELKYAGGKRRRDVVRRRL